MEEINRSGANAGACHAQMYTMGTLLATVSAAQKRAYLPKIASGELRLQAFGVTEPTTGSDTTQLQDNGRAQGRRTTSSAGRKSGFRAPNTPTCCCCWRAPRPIRRARSVPTASRCFLVDLREAVGHGLTVRPIRTMMNHATTELFFDDLDVPAENLDRRGRQGFR